MLRNPIRWSVLSSLVVFIAVGAASGADPAGDAAALDGASLYAQRTCIACHGPDAQTPILPQYPNIAGQNEAYIAQQMRDIKSGARNNANTAAMAGVMHLVSDAEIDVLAKYLAGLPKCP